MSRFEKIIQRVFPSLKLSVLFESVEGERRVIELQDRPCQADDWLRAADLVSAVTARAFCVPKESLQMKSRSKANIAFARQTAMYLLHVVFGGTYQQTGDAFGRERTTVAYACSLVEDERDDERFDRKLATLEDSLARLWYVEQLRAMRSFSPPSRGRAAA